MKLPKAGIKTLLTLLIAGTLVNISYSPHSKHPEIQPKNQDKELRRIDWNYNLLDKKYKTSDFSTDSDTVLLARLVFGEARKKECSTLEKVIVGFTAINRIGYNPVWGGENLREVLLKKSQYSPFNSNNVNRRKIMNPMKYDSTSWAQSMKVSYGILKNIYHDPTSGSKRGATHFHTKEVRPSWSNSKKFSRIILPGKMHHYFYRPTKKGI